MGTVTDTNLHLDKILGLVLGAKQLFAPDPNSPDQKAKNWNDIVTRNPDLLQHPAYNDMKAEYLTGVTVPKQGNLASQIGVGDNTMTGSALGNMLLTGTPKDQQAGLQAGILNYPNPPTDLAPTPTTQAPTQAPVFGGDTKIAVNPDYKTGFDKMFGQRDRKITDAESNRIQMDTRAMLKNLDGTGVPASQAYDFATKFANKTLTQDDINALPQTSIPQVKAVLSAMSQGQDYGTAQGIVTGDGSVSPTTTAPLPQAVIKEKGQIGDAVTKNANTNAQNANTKSQAQAWTQQYQGFEKDMKIKVYESGLRKQDQQLLIAQMPKASSFSSEKAYTDAVNAWQTKADALKTGTGQPAPASKSTKSPSPNAGGLLQSMSPEQLTQYNRLIQDPKVQTQAQIDFIIHKITGK